jgi:hypothetical protein
MVNEHGHFTKDPDSMTAALGPVSALKAHATEVVRHVTARQTTDERGQRADDCGQVTVDREREWRREWLAPLGERAWAR